MGIGALDVQRPKVRDRMAASDGAEKIRFTSNMLPKWARRSVSLNALLPVLYLKGISKGDFPEALAAVMGPCCAIIDPPDRLFDACTAQPRTKHHIATNGWMAGAITPSRRRCSAPATIARTGRARGLPPRLMPKPG